MEDTLAILDLQPAGKKRMTARRLFAWYRFEITDWGPI